MLNLLLPILGILLYHVSPCAKKLVRTLSIVSQLTTEHFANHLLYHYIAGLVLRVDGCMIYHSCRGTTLNEHWNNIWQLNDFLNVVPVQFVNKKSRSLGLMRSASAPRNGKRMGTSFHGHASQYLRCNPIPVVFGSLIWIGWPKGHWKSHVMGPSLIQSSGKSTLWPLTPSVCYEVEWFGQQDCWQRRKLRWLFEHF